MVFLADRQSFHFLGFFCGIPSACGPYSCNTGKWWSCSCCSGFHFRCGTRPGVVRIVQICSMAVCLFASGLRWVRRDPLHWKRRSLLPGLLLHSYPLIWAVLSCLSAIMISTSIALSTASIQGGWCSFNHFGAELGDENLHGDVLECPIVSGSKFFDHSSRAGGIPILVVQLSCSTWAAARSLDLHSCLINSSITCSVESKLVKLAVDPRVKISLAKYTLSDLMFQG